MFLQITARPDAGLTAAALRHSLRRPLLIARIAGWVAIGFAVLHLVAGDRLDYPMLFLGVALAVGVPMLLVNNSTRRAMLDGELTTYEISDAGIAFSSRRSRHAYAWSALTAVEHLPGQLIFRRGRARMLQVPTAGLNAFQIYEVLQVAAAHGLRS